MNFIFGILLYWQILACLCFSRSAIGSWQLLFIIFWKCYFFFFLRKLVFFKKKYMRGIDWTGKEKTIVNTKFSDCVHWAKQKVLHEKARLCGQHRSRKAGVRDCSILGSLSEQDRAGLPGCHTGSLLMRAAPDAFCTEVGNFSLCDK